jgi:hypothetical protein
MPVTKASFSRNEINIDLVSYGKVVKRRKLSFCKMGYHMPPKDQGGPGIINLQLQNKCLLSKWIVNLLNTQGLWQTMLRKNI